MTVFFGPYKRYTTTGSEYRRYRFGRQNHFVAVYKFAFGHWRIFSMGGGLGEPYLSAYNDYSSLEEVMTALDGFIIQAGHKILTKEQFTKLLVLV